MRLRNNERTQQTTTNSIPSPKPIKKCRIIKMAQRRSMDTLQTIKHEYSGKSKKPAKNSVLKKKIIENKI